MCAATGCGCAAAWRRVAGKRVGEKDGHGVTLSDVIVDAIGERCGSSRPPRGFRHPPSITRPGVTRIVSN